MPLPWLQAAPIILVVSLASWFVAWRVGAVVLLLLGMSGCCGVTGTWGCRIVLS